MEKIEDEVGVFSKQFKLVFSWQTRSTGDGIILIVEHGQAICAVVDVLWEYHDRYPSNEVIMKWGRDVLRGVRQIYAKKGLDYPLVSMDPKPNTSKRKRSAFMESAGTEVKVVASSRSDFLGRTPDPPKMVSNISEWIDMSLFIVKRCLPRSTP
ncbi:hypothetical protein HETIRDRAFT_326740 [Heterobasidion irregulare TC 32-1]|uniref:Uncharacterized protein n=1 Tax=Heterobasidion irregulare (strain TC 32-1) TaxID=747525 RepID=W4JUB0_HETIT|nr:uncharacterized protein HETIRDRAFT_326740 [Heterobasidion irregulare TC 32-1]ETW77137.1 hypothetical protein HETIRDRAFT_326740 [Heterobasidion irregulare TC 32-1]